MSEIEIIEGLNVFTKSGEGVIACTPSFVSIRVSRADGKRRLAILRDGQEIAAADLPNDCAVHLAALLTG